VYEQAPYNYDSGCFSWKKTEKNIVKPAYVGTSIFTYFLAHLAEGLHNVKILPPYNVTFYYVVGTYYKRPYFFRFSDCG
jgi:hypothetical protein